MRRILAAAVLVALVMPVSSAFAVTGDVTGRTNVLIPISVTTDLRILDFGDVFPGINKSVAYTDAVNGGKWQVTGEPGKEIDMTFTLPGNLINGLDALPIVFSNADGAWHPTDVVGSATVFDPSLGETQFLDGGAGTMFLWIGGTVQPAPTQPAGVYTAAIMVDVVYTGN